MAQTRIIASAPCRVDCGGSTDHRITALLARHWEPATLTIALSVRTTVTLGPHEPGKILVESEHIGAESCAFPNLPLSGSLGLVFAVAGYFGVHGLRIHVASEAPARSGLGGSAAVSVAMIGALQTLLQPNQAGELDFQRVALLAHQIEDGLYDNTGLQDQAAAAFGGIYLWRWKYGDQLRFDRETVIANSAELASHVVVAYSGAPHAGQRRSSFLENFRRTGDVETVIEIARQAHAMAAALRKRDYAMAARALSSEAKIRSGFMKSDVLAEDENLMTAARDHQCGVRFAGHGGGGAVWAIGEAKAIAILREDWKEILSKRGSGFVFPEGLAHEGLQVRREKLD